MPGLDSEVGLDSLLNALVIPLAVIFSLAATRLLSVHLRLDIKGAD